MGNRGRVSSAALAIITPTGLETVRRPPPPPDLTEEQAAEWQAIVNRLPAEWFPRETWGLLAQYCRHVIRARRLAQLIEKMEQADDFDMREYRLLLRAEEDQSRAMAALATKMRISQQTTYDKSRKKPKSIDRPWS